MLAIAGSTLLLLYVFLPEFLFTLLAFNFRAVTRPQRGRFGELLSGAASALLPFVAAWLGTRTIPLMGRWPLRVPQDAPAKYGDYRSVLNSLYSEAWFREHTDATWAAWDHVRLHQLRFLFWMYLFVLLQIVAVVLLTYYFGTLSQYAWYRGTFGRFFLRRASHWEVLLTGFAFPRKARPQVAVDALTTDAHLYAGTVADYFLRADGELSGLLLKDFRRFRSTQLEEDRKAGLDPDPADYWADIPGANFYLPADKIANLNIRYEEPMGELVKDVEDWMRELDPETTITVTLEAADAGSSEASGKSQPDDRSQ